MTGIDIGKAAIEACGPNIGIGLGKTFAHIDVRGVPVVWNYGGVKAAWVDEVKRFQRSKLGASGQPQPRTGGPSPVPAAAPQGDFGSLAQRAFDTARQAVLSVVEQGAAAARAVAGSVSTAWDGWVQVPGDQRMRVVTKLLVEKYGYPVNAAAGIVGNLWVESAALPNRLEGSRETTPLRARDFAGVMRDFTPEEVRNRNFDARIGPRLPGIGLAQWTTRARRAGLFRHPYEGRSLGTAILDHMAAQVDYLVTELRTGYRHLDRILRDPAVSMDAASDEFVYSFEIPGVILTPQVPGQSRKRRPRGDQAVLDVFKARRRASARALAAYQAADREVLAHA
jgi:hypothetical protein